MADRKSKPSYLQEFQERRGQPKSVNSAVFNVQTKGVGRMSREELKKIGLPIIKEARKRMRLLEEAGLTDSPAYRKIKMYDIPVSTAGKNDNQIRHNIQVAFDFLHAKTSIVENAAGYSSWLDEHLGAETTAEQREKIWDVIHRFEETHPQQFINYGYDEAIKRISKMARLADYDVDKAYDAMVNILKKQEEMDVKGYEPETSARRSPWYRGGSSTFGF